MGHSGSSLHEGPSDSTQDQHNAAVNRRDITPGGDTPLSTRRASRAGRSTRPSLNSLSLISLVPPATFDGPQRYDGRPTELSFRERRRCSVALRANPVSPTPGNDYVPQGQHEIAGPGHSALYNVRMEAFIELGVELMVHTAIGDAVTALVEDTILDSMKLHDLGCRGILDLEDELARMNLRRRRINDQRGPLQRTNTMTGRSFGIESETSRTSTTPSGMVRRTPQSISRSTRGLSESSSKMTDTFKPATISAPAVVKAGHKRVSFVEQNESTQLNVPSNIDHSSEESTDGKNTRWSTYEQHLKSETSALRATRLRSHPRYPPLFVELDLTVGDVTDAKLLEEQVGRLVRHHELRFEDIVQDVLCVFSLAEKEIKALQRQLQQERRALEAEVTQLDYNTRVSGRLRRMFESNENKVRQRRDEALGRLVEVALADALGSTDSTGLIDAENTSPLTTSPGKSSSRVDSLR